MTASSILTTRVSETCMHRHISIEPTFDLRMNSPIPANVEARLKQACRHVSIVAAVLLETALTHSIDDRASISVLSLATRGRNLTVCLSAHSENTSETANTRTTSEIVWMRINMATTDSDCVPGTLDAAEGLMGEAHECHTG